MYLLCHLICIIKLLIHTFKKSDFFYTYVLKTFSRPKKSSNFADKSEFNFQNTIQAV